MLTHDKKKLKGDVKFFMAEDIRLEGNYKPILIDLFPRDEVTLLAMSDDPLPEPANENPTLLHSLAILANVTGFEGNHELKMDLLDPNNTAIFKDTYLGAIEAEGHIETNNANFVARFMPFKVTQLGEYKFVLKITDKEFTHKFIIKK